jgi:NAD(P)-dependent dehydrogenase (short-subunit alcohol dehydrogenase family)
MTDARQPWALILGASSGFGEATKALAAAGYDIAGVHLDPAPMAHVDEIKADIAAHGREALRQHERGRRRQPGRVLAALRTRFDAEPRRPAACHTSASDALAGVRHAQAFLGPDAEARQPQEPGDDLDVSQQPCLLGAGHGAAALGDGSKVMPLTSEGSTRVITNTRGQRRQTALNPTAGSWQ